MISRASVFYNVFTLSLSGIALQLMGFLYRIMLSRLIGAEGMGVYQLALPFYSVLLAVCLSGLSGAVSQLSAELCATRGGRAARSLILRSFVMFLALFCCAAGVTLLYRGGIARHILGDARTACALAVFLPCLFFTGIENLIKNHFYGRKYLRAPIVSELSEQAVRILAVGALLAVYRPKDPGQAAALVALGMVISEVASAGILCLFYRARAPKAEGGVPRGLSARIVRIALPISAASLANNLLGSAISVLIPRQLVASGMAPDAALRLFGVLFGMTMPLAGFFTAFIAPLNTVTAPRLAEGMAVGNAADVRRKAGKAIHSTGLLAFPAAALLIPLGAPLCRMIFKDAAAGAYILPACIATLFSHYQLTTGGILNGIGEQRYAAGCVLGCGVIELVCTAACGIEGIGIYGFLIGCIASSALCAALNLRRIVRRLGLRVRRRNWFVTPCLSAVSAGLCARLIHRMLCAEGVAELQAIAAAAAAAVCVYLTALAAQGTSPRRYLRMLK